MSRFFNIFSILLLTLIPMAFLGCATKKIVKTERTAQTGVLTYKNFKETPKEEFLTEIQKSIHCPESYQDTSSESYNEYLGSGTFSYQCFSYDEHCRNGHGKSCFILGLEQINENPAGALSFFTKSCGDLYSKGCYFAGMLASDLNDKNQFFDTSCTLGWTKACDEKDPAYAQTPINAQLAYVENFIKEQNAETTPSGLVFKNIKEGSGRSPALNDKVLVHYEGKLIDGTMFDSSYSRGKPVELSLTQVIAGWTEGLQLMKEGGKMQLVIPAHLAYGSQGIEGKVPAQATLLFDIELIKVQ